MRSPLSLGFNIGISLTTALSGCGISPLPGQFDYNLEARREAVTAKLEDFRNNRGVVCESDYKSYSKVLKSTHDEPLMSEKVFAVEEVNRLLDVHEDFFKRKMKRESESLNKREDLLPKALQGAI